MQKSSPDEPTSSSPTTPAARLRAVQSAVLRGMPGAEHTLRGLLADAVAARDEAFAAEVGMALGEWELRAGHLDGAISTLGEARQRYVILGDVAGELAALRLVGTAWTMLGDLMRARAVFSLGVELARRAALVEAHAVALANTALTWGEANENQVCTDLTWEALALLRPLGDKRRIAHALVNYAEGLTRLGRLDEADAAAAEGVSAATAVGEERLLALLEGGRGDRAARRGELEEAESRIRAARARLDALRLPYDSGQMTLLLADALRRSGQLDAAERECARALQELADGSYHGVKMALLETLSVLYEAGGKVAQALETLRERQRQQQAFEHNPARMKAYRIEELQRAEFAREGSKREQATRNALVDANRQLAAALARERRERVVLQAEAVTDPLTAVLNRRGFMELAVISLDNAQRTGDPLSIAVLDLDHFKSVNDTYGHRAGDLVLAAVANAATGCLRGHDLFGRVGGEEFVALIAHADRAVAQLVAERIRRKVSTLKIPVQEVLLTCTVSVGVAPFTPGITLERLVECADEALYAAKREGRDRVVMYRPPAAG